MNMIWIFDRSQEEKNEFDHLKKRRIKMGKKHLSLKLTCELKME